MARRIACINDLEAIVDKVPDAMDYLSKATGPLRPSKSRRPVRRMFHACSAGVTDECPRRSEPGGFHDQPRFDPVLRRACQFGVL